MGFTSRSGPDGVTIGGNAESKIIINDSHTNLVISESPFGGDCEGVFSGELTMRITGRFPQDIGFGLNGDLNQDGDIDVLDIVMMVEIILSDDA